MGWKQKQLLKGLIIVLIFVGGIVSYQLYGINLGLDLRGGSHVVMEAQDTEERKVDPSVMVALERIIERRVNQLGLAEPRIQRSGERRLIIELPAVDEPEQAIQIIGATAQLTFEDMEGRVLLTGEYLTDARAERDPMFQHPIIAFQLNREGATIFEQATREYLGQRIRIMLDDDEIYSGTVEDVIRDRGQIRGFQTLEDAQNVAMLLREGALPVPLVMQENRTVGPTLGQIAIDQSLRAGIVGIILVALAMAFLYRHMGLIASLSLIIYGFVFVGILSGFRAVLTLPGIAGLILSIGMAVDANIIIFERIKEERAFGKSIRAAIDSGFRRATTTILDANVTTLITALILAYFTSGTVRGFAVTLIIGLVSSMFTALFVTRSLMDFFYDFKLFKTIKTFELIRR